MSYADIKTLSQDIQQLIRDNAMDEKDYDLTVTEEKINAHKDIIEQNTGIFHWKGPKGEYHPITELSSSKLQTAYIHCEIQMNKMHKEIQRKKKELERLKLKLISEIEQAFDDLCGWEYKIRKVEEEAERRGIELDSIKEIRERRQKEKDDNREDIIGD